MNRPISGMNLLQLSGWFVVFIASVFNYTECPLWLLWLTLALHLPGVSDLLGSSFKGKRWITLLPAALQNGARMIFTALLLLAKQQGIVWKLEGKIDAASLLLTIWSLAEISRFLYYISRSRATKWLRYNAFIVLYPTGVILESIWMYRLFIQLPFISCKILLVVMALAYLFGFPYLFLHLFQSRKQKLKHE